MIWKLSGNKSIERALNAVCPPLFASYLIKASSGEPYNRAKDLEEHRALANSFRAGKPEHVRKVFEEIIDTFRSHDIENLRAAGGGSEIEELSSHYSVLGVAGS